MEKTHIAKEEWRFVGYFSAIVSVVLLLPYLAGHLVQRGVGIFLGSPTVTEIDYLSYLAWINQAAHGVTLFHDYSASVAFSATGSLFHPIFLTLGTIAHYVCVSPMTVYHVASAAMAFIVLLVSYRFIAHFAADVIVRRTALVLLPFASGVGALLFLPPNEFNFPEYSMFVRMSESLLGSIDTVITLTIFIVALEDLGKGKRRDALLVGLLFGMLVLVHPYMVVVTFATLVCYGGYRYISARDARLFFPLVIALEVLLPFALWQAFALSRDSSFALWFFSGMSTARFSVIEMILGYGLLLPLAGYGLWIAKKTHRNNSFVLLCVWGIVMLTFLYQPFFASATRRFAEMFFIPLTLFSALPIAMLWKKKREHRIVAVLILVVLAGGNVLYYIHEWRAFVWRDWNVQSVTSDEVHVAQWLASHARPSQMILSGARMARVLPIFTTARLYFGHPQLTPGMREKVQQLPILFDNQFSQTYRAWSMIGEEVTYVIEDQELRDFGFHGEHNPCMAKTLDAGSIKIYRMLLPCVE